MSQTQAVSNPFGLMLDPEAVVKAMECSERLARLQSRVYRPLDKPLISKKGMPEGPGAPLERDED
jgi:hypothetical protein